MIKRALVFILLFLFQTHVFAAPAKDAVSNAAAGTGNFSWTHTPVGTPRGVLVKCTGTGGVDGFTSASYGSASLTDVTGSPNVLVAGENGNVSVFFAGSSIPTGAQTVSVTVSGTTDKRCVAITLTASADLEIVDSDGTINSTSQANPSVTISLGGRSSFVAIAFYSGQGDPTGITPFTGWTADLEHDWGSDVAGWYTYDTVGTTDVTAGWTQLADDAAMVAVAVAEVVAAGTTFWPIVVG